MELYRTIAFGFVIACWVAYALVFLLQKRPGARKEQKSAPASRIGIIIEACAYAMVWSIRRNYVLPFLPLPPIVESALLVVICLIAACSVWLTLSAVRALGKQWSVVARVFEGHELVTAGPYGFVRNPIYTGMFGMLIATGVATGRWPVLLIATALFFLGTVVRIRSEEKILRDTFGQKFEEYAARVSALIPGIF